MRTCLRCRTDKNVSKFIPEEGSNYFEHNVCNTCREFMEKRANYLIRCDKKFHSVQKMDFDLTQVYRRRFVNR